MTHPPLRILLAGESWDTYAIHTKGASSYTTSSYAEGADQLIGCLRTAGHDVEYLPNHRVAEEFPYTAADLRERFDVVVLSDLPSDSLLLPHAVFVEGERRPNRTASLVEFVEGGGGLLMIGGYMSFAGFEGRARYGSTALGRALPVEISSFDDRAELPEGVVPTPGADHPILEGLAGAWPYLLGYNRVAAKPGATTLLRVGADPLLVVDRLSNGRVAAFTSDCSPHWGSPDFMAWPHYGRFWNQLVQWLAGEGTVA